MNINAELAKLVSQLKREETFFNFADNNYEIDASIYKMKSIETQIRGIIDRNKKEHRQMLPENTNKYLLALYNGLEKFATLGGRFPCNFEKLWKQK